MYATEAEFCAACLPLLKATGVVYPEITGIDYVVVREAGEDVDQPRVIAVEAKLVMNADVLRQAWTRLESGAVDAAFVMVPGRARVFDPFWKATAAGLGIGVLWLKEYPRPVLVEEVKAVERVRANDDVFKLLRPEALEHTVAGLPSSKKWNQWDDLECRYVQAVRDHVRYYGVTPALDRVVAAVEPEAVGKRGGVLKRYLERVDTLIRCGRWKKLAISHGRLEVVDTI